MKKAQTFVMFVLTNIRQAANEPPKQEALRLFGVWGFCFASPAAIRPPAKPSALGRSRALGAVSHRHLPVSQWQFHRQECIIT